MLRTECLLQRAGFKALVLSYWQCMLKHSWWRNKQSLSQIWHILFLFFQAYSRLSLKVSFKAILFGDPGFVKRWTGGPSLLNKHCFVVVVAELLFSFFFFSFLFPLPVVLQQNISLFKIIKAFPSGYPLVAFYLVVIGKWLSRTDFLIIASLAGSLQLILRLFLWTSSPDLCTDLLTMSPLRLCTFEPLELSSRTTCMTAVFRIQ